MQIVLAVGELTGPHTGQFMTTLGKIQMTGNTLECQQIRNPIV